MAEEVSIGTEKQSMAVSFTDRLGFSPVRSFAAIQSYRRPK